MNRTLSLLAPALGALTACGLKAGDVFTSATPIQVREVGRSLQCNTPGPEPHAQLLDDGAAAWSWQKSRGINLAGRESLGDSPYAVVETGAKHTGGYGLAVSRAAALQGDLVILNATFISPGENSMVTQALTSPCALVELPAGRYRSIEVRDPSGAVRASGSDAPPPPDTEPASPSSSPPVS